MTRGRAIKYRVQGVVTSLLAGAGVFYVATGGKGDAIVGTVGLVFVVAALFAPPDGKDRAP